MIAKKGTNGRSVPEVLQDIAGDIEELARSEFLLAKVEIKAEVAGTAKVSRTLGAGIVLGFFSLGFALLAAMYALATVVAQWVAALVISVAVGITAIAMITVGIGKLKKYGRAGKSVNKLSVKENGKWASNPTTSRDTLRTDANV